MRSLLPRTAIILAALVCLLVGPLPQMQAQEAALIVSTLGRVLQEGPSVSLVAQERAPDADLPPIAVAFGDAWSSHDPEQLVAIYAEDAIFEEIVLGGAVTTNREELAAYAAAVYAAFPDFAATPVNGFSSGDQAVLEWILSGTYSGQFGPLPPGEGQQVEIRVVTVFELTEDGLIQHDREYWDFATLLDQLGLMPGAEATPAP